MHKYYEIKIKFFHSFQKNSYNIKIKIKLNRLFKVNLFNKSNENQFIYFRKKMINKYE